MSLNQSGKNGNENTYIKETKMKTRSWLLILLVALAMALASACAPTGGDAEPDTGDR